MSESKIWCVFENCPAVEEAFLDNHGTLLPKKYHNQTYVVIDYIHILLKIQCLIFGFIEASLNTRLLKYFYTLDLEKKKYYRRRFIFYKN